MSPDRPESMWASIGRCAAPLLPAPRLTLVCLVQYASAVATDHMRAPKVAVGGSATSEIKAALHVDSADVIAAALFTGQGKVAVDIVSPSTHAALSLAAGKAKWELGVPSSGEFLVGTPGSKASLRVVDGKLGVNTDSKPTKSIHIESSAKGDSIMMQGNFDGKTEGMMDALVTLESSVDRRGRGVFLPHRDRSEGGKTHAWFAGVPSGGVGFSIGSSGTHLHESKAGPYTKESSRVFITPDGRVGVGTTSPVGQFDVQVPEGSKTADTSVNVKGGSINVDLGRGVFTDGIAAMVGDAGVLSFGSAKPKEGREIRLQAGAEGAFVVITRDNGWVGIGGVKAPATPLHLHGDMTVDSGSVRIENEPQDGKQMLVLDSKATTPSSVGFQQGGKHYMAISAGNKGGTIEMANNVDLTITGGKVGFGTDPTELVHVKGGNVLLDGRSSLNFDNVAAGSKIWEDSGLHLTSVQNGKVLVDNAEFQVSNTGSEAQVIVKADADKDAVLQLASGAASWNVKMSQTAQSTLMFSQKATLMALTTAGHLGLGVTAPMEKIHAMGSMILEQSESPVYATMKTKAEERLAGIKLASGTTEWRLETQGAANGPVLPGSLQLVGGDKTHMVVSKTGGVGIGLDAPQPGTSLHVKGAAMFDVGTEKGKIVLSTPSLNPGLSFFNNAGTRIVDIEATTTGLSFMRTGFIGMGTKEPKTRLHVHDAKDSAISVSRSTKVSSQSIWSYNGAYVQFGSTSSDGLQFIVNKVAQMTIHPNGKVGVHTATPQSDFQIKSRTHFMQVAQASYFSGNAFYDGAKFKYTENGGAAAVKVYPNGKIGFVTAKTGNSNMAVEGFDKARLIVTDTGSVGVGTENPDTMLHVASEQEATLSKHGALMVGLDNLNKNIVLDSQTVQTRTKGQPSPIKINPFGGDVTIFASVEGDAAKSVFTATGNIGFGTLKPEAKLHVSEGKGKFTTLALGESDTGSAVIRYKASMMTMGFSKSSAAATNQEDAIVVKNDGRVGIGMTAPAAHLHVKGDVIISGTLNVGGKSIEGAMEEMRQENQSLRSELAETKEMMMSMSANLRRMSELMSKLEAR